MHVASTLIFEGQTPSYEELRAHLEARLDRVPRFRQKLRFVPLGQGRPVWVDDPTLNLGYHVRHTALPEPGDEDALRTLAARIFSQRLDRSKPLWELWLVDNLEGDRFAIVGKSHHCLVDGVSGVDITTVLFDAEPDPAPEPSAPRWVADPEPSDAQLLADAIRERIVDPREAARGARALMRHPRRALGALVEAIEAIGTVAGSGLAAPPSPLNVDVGPHRRFAWVRADLEDLKRVKRAHGGTVNDVVLAAVAGALGRYLRARGHSIAGLELRAMVPVSVHSAEHEGTLGNHVTAMMAPLPVGVADPLERLRLVSAEMDELKDSRQAVGAELLTELAGFAPSTLVSQAARLQSRQRMFNLVVTNVPGPQFPLYLLGRRLLDVFPMVPLAACQALCVGLMSYDGAINFGLVGDLDAMAGLDSFAADLEGALTEMVAAGQGGEDREAADAGIRQAEPDARGSRA
jgi:diacylglycerol O-acyltransferase / wax synthase